jgi:hypothetical protein
VESLRVLPIFNREKIKIKVSLKGGEENIVEFECKFADSS